MKSTDIQVQEIRYQYEDFLYRTPIKFGGVALDRATILNVHCVIETRDNKRAIGFGSMPLGNVWSFPSRKLTYDQTLQAMKAVVSEVCRITEEYKELGHPIDITW